MNTNKIILQKVRLPLDLGRNFLRNGGLGAVKVISWIAYSNQQD
jgi:hypothetical protein